ncbi:protein toll-like isoform X2 [Leptinotarsa decemlineata]|uniref:protein toll-like isoform X2 n=1 Tax=Leptinotarsa decemlineata TaxID=7539 RepID=UPI003D30AC95
MLTLKHLNLLEHPKFEEQGIKDLLDVLQLSDHFLLTDMYGCLSGWISCYVMKPHNVTDLCQWSLGSGLKQLSKTEVTDLKKLTPKELVVDLGNNKISEIDFEDAESLAEINFQELDMKDIVPATTVLLHNNPVICDCRVYNLVQYVRDMLKTSLKTMVDLKLGDTSCSSPQLLEHIKVEDLKPQNVTCPYGMKCSVGDCQCFYRPYDNAVVIDCSNKNFTECPRIESEGEKVELNLVGNSIRYGPNSSLGYDNVTTLYLSKNRIEQIEWVPPKIKILKLDDNQLTHLNSEVLKMINSTSVLRLSNNPWTCDCSALEFQG